MILFCSCTNNIKIEESQIYSKYDDEIQKGCSHIYNLDSINNNTEFIETIDLRQDTIKDFLNTSLKFPNLKKIIFSYCYIIDIKNLIINLSKLDALEEVHFVLNNFNRLPREVNQLKKIKSFRIIFPDYCTYIPVELFELEQLEELVIERAHIDDVQIHKLIKLQSLSLIHCNIKTIPNLAEYLNCLTVFNLNSNPIKSLDVPFNDFNNLKVLQLMNTMVSRKALKDYNKFLNSKEYLTFEKKCNSCKLELFDRLKYQ